MKAERIAEKEERKMFEKGDMIVYGNSGVCRVEDVGLPQQIPATDNDTLYYKLDPIYSVGLIYIPVDAPVAMRRVLTREQAEHLVDAIPQVKEKDVSGLDTRTLTQRYKSALAGQNCCDLVSLIKTVKHKNEDAEARGRRPGKIDKEYLKRAQELLYGELAVALDIPKENVNGYIHTRLCSEPAKSKS